MRLGVLDIGSNTVHLLLIDAYPGARPTAFASHKRPLSLVAYLDEDGAITEDGQRELLDFVHEASLFATRHRAEDLLAFCTSAIRSASNGPAVLDRVVQETGIQLAELSGEQESGMTYHAVRRWFGWSSERILDLDIGGGSFEMAYGTDEFPELALSVPLGAGRLTRDWLPGDPPRTSDVKALRAHVKETLAEPLALIAEHPKPTLVTGTSKTFRSLARITGAAPSAEGIHVKRVLRLDDLKLWTRRLEAMTTLERTELPGVSEVRAPQMLAGAIVASVAMNTLGVKSLRICPWALREGLILRRFDHLIFDGPLPLGSSVGVGHVELGQLPGLPTVGAVD
ncbi:MAG: Ppx/GppA phosphatase family protein [Arthrobacter sp.]|uniref:Ppx/GppA phosphatase family protein n=1 Tax=unclassified Arthrobacter TaxID=235627 RepID=UPI00264EF27A|nr:Ppx/GppA family phosphatase [Micrococcaceae bacterium]MDN5823133.1 Ppx/GppA family phosphatase [Micrococcaceae bacterium]MDN5878522.1 Ppx/GppA family phosphatase [Micrococcaceae bacterium]MDN5885422.1 Ppx/GppA family phosphatase [Micrococcaceae bacterium]MDN5904252.1 Ppx/GppA family phosphatase [Micrococcaceae bacterium]